MQLTTKILRNDLITCVTVMEGSSELGDVHLPPTLTNGERNGSLTLRPNFEPLPAFSLFSDDLPQILKTL